MRSSDRGPALAELRRELAGAVLDALGERLAWASDASHLPGDPMAGVRPSDVDDLVRLVKWARHWKVPLVPRGSGTSLDGEATVGPGAVAVDLSGWTAPLEVDPLERRARVGAGVVNRTLQLAAKPHGLFFPPNPGSWTTCTLGGNVATNASGPRSYRYGPTRAWTVGATIVLGTGEVVRVGTEARKRSAGPDPLGYLVGSEGTLGFFVELVFRLAPVPERRTALVVPVDDDRAACELAQVLDRISGVVVSAVEYLDPPSAEALASEAGRSLPADSGLVLVEAESTEAEEEHALARLGEVVKGAGVREDPWVFPDADSLWTLRGRSGAILDERFGARVREDVAVPLARSPLLFELIHRVADSHRVPVWVYGHLGDGNLHPNFGVDPSGPVARSIRSDLWAGVHDLGGTISGEHGVGSLKRAALVQEHPEAVVRWMRALRSECDPDGVMNPGKLYPDDLPGARGSSSPSHEGSAGRRAPPG